MFVDSPWRSLSDPLPISLRSQLSNEQIRASISEDQALRISPSRTECRRDCLDMNDLWTGNQILLASAQDGLLPSSRSSIQTFRDSAVDSFRRPTISSMVSDRPPVSGGLDPLSSEEAASLAAMTRTSQTPGSEIPYQERAEAQGPPLDRSEFCQTENHGRATHINADVAVVDGSLPPAPRREITERRRLH
jgi:hypothetical protein